MQWEGVDILSSVEERTEIISPRLRKELKQWRKELKQLLFLHLLSLFIDMVLQSVLFIVTNSVRGFYFETKSHLSESHRITE